MKRRLRRIVVATVVVLLCGVTGLVARSMWQQRRQPVVPGGFEFIPGVSQHIRDFHRVKVQNGRKVWEISAKDARYYDKSKAVVVRDAAMQLVLQDGRIVGLRGDQARILLDGREVSRVDLDGDIEVRLAEYTVHTDRAEYDHRNGRISVPGAVEISGPALQLRGDSMEVDVESERLTLLHHISMHLQPALLKQGGANGAL
jgi:LPS export ABC transporter protein LptC